MISFSQIANVCCAYIKNIGLHAEYSTPVLPVDISAEIFPTSISEIYFQEVINGWFLNEFIFQRKVHIAW